jgi:hypothetical protein
MNVIFVLVSAKAWEIDEYVQYHYVRYRLLLNISRSSRPLRSICYNIHLIPSFQKRNSEFSHQ